MKPKDINRTFFLIILSAFTLLCLVAYGTLPHTIVPRVLLGIGILFLVIGIPSMIPQFRYRRRFITAFLEFHKTHPTSYQCFLGWVTGIYGVLSIEDDGITFWRLKHGVLVARQHHPKQGLAIKKGRVAANYGWLEGVQLFDGSDDKIGSAFVILPDPLPDKPFAGRKPYEGHDLDVLLESWKEKLRLN